MDDADALDTSFDCICEDFDESQDLLGCSPAEKFYLENNQSMLSLILLIGARDESGLPLLDVENDPWKTYQKNLSSHCLMPCVQRSDVAGTHHCSKMGRRQHPNIGIKIK